MAGNPKYSWSIRLQASLISYILRKKIRAFSNFWYENAIQIRKKLRLMFLAGHGMVGPARHT